jgi:hypothetical protein
MRRLHVCSTWKPCAFLGWPQSRAVAQHISELL